MKTEYAAHSGSQMNKFCSCSPSAGGSRKHLPACEIMLEIKLEMKFHAPVPGNIENKGHKFVPSCSRYSHTAYFPKIVILFYFCRCLIKYSHCCPHLAAPLSWCRNGLQFSAPAKTTILLPLSPPPPGGTKGKDHGLR